MIVINDEIYSVDKKLNRRNYRVPEKSQNVYFFLTRKIQIFNKVSLII